MRFTSRDSIRTPRRLVASEPMAFLVRIPAFLPVLLLNACPVIGEPGSGNAPIIHDEVDIGGVSTSVRERLGAGLGRKVDEALIRQGNPSFEHPGPSCDPIFLQAKALGDRRVGDHILRNRHRHRRQAGSAQAHTVRAGGGARPTCQFRHALRGARLAQQLRNRAACAGQGRAGPCRVQPRCSAQRQRRPARAASRATGPG